MTDIIDAIARTRAERIALRGMEPTAAQGQTITEAERLDATGRHCTRCGVALQGRKLGERDWIWLDDQGSTHGYAGPEDQAAFWDDLRANDIATYSVMRAAAGLGMTGWWHYHTPATDLPEGGPAVLAQALDALRAERETAGIGGLDLDELGDPTEADLEDVELELADLLDEERELAAADEIDEEWTP